MTVEILMSANKSYKTSMVAIFFIAVSICISGCSGVSKKTEIASFLISVQKNEALKAEQARRDNENFSRLKKYIIKNRLKAGISMADCLARFGEPVIRTSQDAGQRWAYKPSYEGWVGGEKIYLFFNKDQILASWQLQQPGP